jgi:hypothetical protein
MNLEIHRHVLQQSSAASKLAKGTVLGMIIFFTTTGNSHFAAEEQKLFAAYRNCTIVIPATPSAIETFAARELQHFLEKAYTRNLVLNGTDEPIQFYVGTGLEAMLAGFEDLPAAGDDFGISVRGRAILLHGHDNAVEPLDSIGRTGTLLAVYYFLTRHAGVEFFFPGEKGVAITQDKSIVLRIKDDVPRPSFSLRGFYQLTNEFSPEERSLFAKRMLCTQPLWMRSQSYYFEQWGKKYFKTNPEYFAEVEGKRVFHHYHNCNPCFSNPDVVRRFAGEIIEIFRAHPETGSVRLFSDNKYGPCQCDRCSNSKVRAVSKEQGNFSEEYFAFVAQVAQIIFRVCPDRRIICNTKRDHYDMPPRTIKLDSRVTIDFLTSRSDPCAYPETLGEQLGKIDAWVADGHDVFIKSYNRYPHFKNYPLMTQHYIARAARLFGGHILGMQRSDNNKDTPFVFSALNNYAQGKLLFDCQADVDGLIAQFVAHAYPGAEKEMTAFYDEMERLWASKQSFSLEPLYDIYTPETLAKPLALLESAKLKLERHSWLFDKMETAFKEFYALSTAIDRSVLEGREKNLKPVLVKRATAPIVIDGVIHDDEWVGAAALQLQPNLKMLANADAEEPFQPSSVRMLHDGAKLYLALEADERRMQDLTSRSHINGEGVPWSDDSFEIMLAPTGQRPYFQIVVNAEGCYRVLTVTGKSNREPDRLQLVDDLKLIKSDKGFFIECSIDLQIFPPDQRLQEWKFNVFRNRIAAGASGMQRLVRQASGLSLFGESFHDISTYVFLRWEQ